MAIERYRAETLRKLLKKRKIATMAELKESLGTDVDVTVTRKLKELSYRTSYSHRGGYYTLDEIARFDDLGLWSFRSVWFSRYGTLLATAEACVEASEAGYYPSELENVLHVGVKDALRKLVSDARLMRVLMTASCRGFYPGGQTVTIRLEQYIATFTGRPHWMVCPRASVL